MICKRALALLALVSSFARADELSGADKLRVVYSNQFAWTKDGLPLVTVRVAEHRDRVTLSATGGLRLLPDGDGGAELRAGARWTVTVEGGRPGKVRWHVVLARGRPDDADQLRRLALGLRRDPAVRTVELGTVFGVRGQVVDGRELLLLDAGGFDDETAARAEAARLSPGRALAVLPRLVERPRGTVVATDERGTIVRNDGILWFAAADNQGGGLIEVSDIDKEGAGSSPASPAGSAGAREARRYFGRLYVTVDGTGKLAVVNAVPEDKLLAGLVPAEMRAGAPPEALKAQAVAARNELLAKIGTRHLTDPYRLCATQHCQVYAGAGREDPRSTAAVQATRGELLVHAGTGGLVDAVYSASCGGHTEDNERAWGGKPDPSLRGALDLDAADAQRLTRIGEPEIQRWLAPADGAPRPYCARPRGAEKSYRWSARVDAATVAARAGLGALRGLEVVERGVSGRITRLRIVGDGGQKEVSGELEVRRALGGLKSAMFVLAVEKDAGGHVTALRADGGGHGHGIGMCQLGAEAMAESGKGYREILRHYYSASELRKLY